MSLREISFQPTISKVRGIMTRVLRVPGTKQLVAKKTRQTSDTTLCPDRLKFVKPEDIIVDELRSINQYGLRLLISSNIFLASHVHTVPGGERMGQSRAIDWARSAGLL